MSRNPIWPSNRYGRLFLPKKVGYLYEKKRMTLQELGKMFRVSHATIGRWLKRNGVKSRHLQPDRGKLSKNWKGGIIEDRKTGRVSIYCPGHPHGAANNGNYVHRAILAWEKKNGPLPKGHVVHHKNEKPWDDRPKNLQAMTKSAHQKHHQLGKRYSIQAKNNMSKAREEWWKSEAGLAEKRRRRRECNRN
jgi:hypothetical protein